MECNRVIQIHSGFISIVQNSLQYLGKDLKFIGVKLVQKIIEFQN